MHFGQLNGVYCQLNHPAIFVSRVTSFTSHPEELYFAAFFHVVFYVFDITQLLSCIRQILAVGLVFISFVSISLG